MLATVSTSPGASPLVPVSVADPDPGSGAFLPPGSGIRDGAMVGSGIRDKQTKFVNSLYTKIGRIRDPVLFYPSDPGSGIKHPGSATLVPVPVVYDYFRVA
jgi:hypothetical protein